MQKQSGFTFVEIMIALVIGLVVVAAVISMYGATAKSGSDTIKSSRLNHDLEAVMALMINDIKRAGYWAGATVATDTRTNPFTAATTNIQIPSSNCILYTYDADPDGPDNDTGIKTPTILTDDIDDNEYYGFKFENNSIKIRKTGTTTADCTNGTWEEFVDGNQLTITALQFNFTDMATPSLPATSRCLNITTGAVTDAAMCTPVTSGDNLAQKRVVNITLAGELSSDSSIKKSLNGTVEIRNNRILIAP
jgi:prepilin peptidase dependent protein B